jgi:serine/threonine protein kinase
MNRVGPLGVKEILRIGVQVASGLAAAHSQGLVHRDIKPSNILLENSVERVKITDFGLARTAGESSVTAVGALAVKPSYMSPEQARGDGIDHRTDLFSLGSVLYAMCTGRSPCRAEDAMAVLRKVIEEEPRPIDGRNRDIPEWLVGIVNKL